MERHDLRVVPFFTLTLKIISDIVYIHEKEWRQYRDENAESKNEMPLHESSACSKCSLTIV